MAQEEEGKPARFQRFSEIRKSSSEIDRFPGRFAVADTCNTKGHVARERAKSRSGALAPRCRGRASREEPIHFVPWNSIVRCTNWERETENERSSSGVSPKTNETDRERRSTRRFSVVSSLFSLFAFLRLPRACSEPIHRKPSRSHEERY